MRKKFYVMTFVDHDMEKVYWRLLESFSNGVIRFYYILEGSLWALM